MNNIYGSKIFSDSCPDGFGCDLMAFLKHRPNEIITSIEVDCGCGSSISDAYKELIEYAGRVESRVGYKVPVFFNGNGIKWIATADSPVDLVEKWINRCYDWKIEEIGPDYPVFSAEDVAFYTEVTDIRKQIGGLRGQISSLQHKIDELELNRAIANEEFDTDDPEGLANLIELNSRDGYSKSGLNYMLRLGKRIQVDRRTHAIDKLWWDSTEREVDIDGITGYQHGWVVAMLKKFWKHADEYAEFLQ